MRTIRHTALTVVLMSAWLVTLADAAEVVIAVTGETHGSLTPCNCPVEPDGGLARRVSFLKTLRRETESQGKDLILVDIGGNAAGGPHDSSPVDKELMLEKSDLIFATMSGLGYDAVCAADDMR